MKSKEWVDLIVKEFNVSRSYAKEMYHTLIDIYTIYKNFKEIK